MARRRHRLLWLATTPNRKTGCVPTAYIGTTLEEVRDSCRGCPLLEKQCYAWAGWNRMAMTRHERGHRQNPRRYQLDDVLKRVLKSARFARIGAMGDPAHADRRNLRADLRKLERAGLAVISYTHFWREPYAQDLQDVCMASCETVEDARAALGRGWRPAMVLPWDHYETSGQRFYLGPQEGIVCPAQIPRDPASGRAVTCNTCQLCRPEHPVWSAGKIQAIGFLDHSRRANGERRRMRGVEQLPLFAPERRRSAHAT